MNKGFSLLVSYMECGCDEISFSHNDEAYYTIYCGLDCHVIENYCPLDKVPYDLIEMAISLLKGKGCKIPTYQATPEMEMPDFIEGRVISDGNVEFKIADRTSITCCLKQFAQQVLDALDATLNVHANDGHELKWHHMFPFERLEYLRSLLDAKNRAKD